jgi:hypothetical protein
MIYGLLSIGQDNSKERLIRQERLGETIHNYCLMAIEMNCLHNCVQAALVIRGLFICGFAYKHFKIGPI